MVYDRGVKAVGGFIFRMCYLWFFNVFGSGRRRRVCIDSLLLDGVWSNVITVIREVGILVQVFYLFFHSSWSY